LTGPSTKYYAAALGPGPAAAHRAEHDAAIGAAWMTKGVFEVHDGIYVTG
jgi:hypothetical protein